MLNSSGMVGQAIVKPEDLRKFASELKSFNGILDSECKRLYMKFRRVGETWRDQEHQRFSQEFDQATKVFKKFIEESEQYVIYLTRKAESAERYLTQR